MSKAESQFVVQSIATSAATMTRMRSEVALPDSADIPQRDAASIIVQLRSFASHSLWRDGKHVFSGGHREGALAITDLRDGWRCHHGSAFDNVRLRVEHQTLQKLARDLGIGRPVSLVNPAGAQDPVLLSLARALLPSLEYPERGDRLFLDHVVGACLTHVLRAYGGGLDPGRRRPRLTSRQEVRAKEILAAHLLGNISIDEVAAQCNLSRSYFIRAFRETTGQTPYQWLIERRIDLVKDLLGGPMSILKIAVDCGFADQSHLTRVFKQVTGLTPAKWRRLSEK